MIPYNTVPLFRGLNLRTPAVGLQSAYIAGAQPELESLRRTMVIDGDRLRAPRDPENPAEISFWFSLHAMIRDAEEQGTPLTAERVLGTVAIAGISVVEAFERIGEDHPSLLVPRLYRETMPRTFGNVTHFEPLALYDRIASEIGVSQPVY